MLVSRSEEYTESSKLRPSMSLYQAVQNRDPSLQAYADMLGRKHNVQHSASESLSDSRFLHDEIQADAELQPSRPVNLFAQVNTSHDSRTESRDHETGLGHEEALNIVTPSIVRPRPVHSMDPLKVAMTVSRMGSQQRARKRQLAQKFANLVNKHYVVDTFLPSALLWMIYSSLSSIQMKELTWMVMENPQPFASQSCGQKLPRIA